MAWRFKQAQRLLMAYMKEQQWSSATYNLHLNACKRMPAAVVKPCVAVLDQAKRGPHDFGTLKGSRLF